MGDIKPSSSTDSNAIKKERKLISLKTKLDILRRIDSGERQIEVSNNLGLAGSTVRTIVKNRDPLIAAGLTTIPLHSKSLTRTRPPIMAEMEKLLNIFIEDSIERKIHLSIPIIQEKALRLHEDLKRQHTNEAIEPFVASKGWYERFKKRSNLHNIFGIHGKNKSILEENLLVTDLPKILGKGGNEMLVIDDKIKFEIDEAEDNSTEPAYSIEPYTDMDLELANSPLSPKEQLNLHEVVVKVEQSTDVAEKIDSEDLVIDERKESLNFDLGLFKEEMIPVKCEFVNVDEFNSDSDNDYTNEQKNDSENDYLEENLQEVAEVTSTNSLREKSQKKYDTVYRAFIDWQSFNKITSFSEKILLTYFMELSKTYKATSLWAFYSILKNTLKVNNKVDIKNYTKLCAFLKRKSIGYRPKKAKTFSQDEITRFIKTAPDTVYLATKVALILGIMGSCCANELHSMSIQDFEDHGSSVLVTISNAKSKIRKFRIPDQYYKIYKKYADLRPTTSPTSFFLNYQNGRCTSQRIGINKFGAMGKQIAKFLMLPNPEMYTGHSFRRSSSSLLLDRGGLPAWKPEEVLQFQSVAGENMDYSLGNKSNTSSEPVQHIGFEENVDDSMGNKSNTSSESVQLITSTTSIQNITASNEIFNFDICSMPSIHFTNCTNITINFITNKK